jgi:hypothetical protein
VAACGPSKPKGGTPDAPVAQCSPGQQQCSGQTLQTCGPDGTFMDTQVCANACDPQLGCVLCVPGTGTCSGNTSMVCNATGNGYDPVVCDPVEGSTCDATSGLCTGDCSPTAIGQSYIGCEYYPTVTGNMVSDAYQFAVAVANTTSKTAMVTIEDGALTAPDVITVMPNSVQVEYLPWQPDLKLCMGPSWSNCYNGVQADGALIAKGAYHLRSTEPVTVYQFNPLDYFLASAPENSYTNDASLLLPTNAWRNEYYTASWEFVGVAPTSNPSEMAVTATQDNTMVTINTRANTLAGGGAPAFTAGTPQTVMLNAGGVLEITSRDGDLTGSYVTSDKPVQVIGGHYCADVPSTAGYCDHLEESMFPVATLGAKYVVEAPAVTTSPNGKIQYVRIIGTTANTTLTFDPPQPGVQTVIANPGDFIEIPDTVASFQVTADHKIMVAQYMEGSSTTADNTGDPSLALAVPVEQYRMQYLFDSPTNYTTNYVDVVAPMGDVVTLDGTTKVNFTPIGGSNTWGLARVVPLDNGPGGDGRHSIVGTMPFGIQVYGYGQDTSYWYPGGLNLQTIVVN